MVVPDSGLGRMWPNSTYAALVCFWGWEQKQQSLRLWSLLGCGQQQKSL